MSSATTDTQTTESDDEWTPGRIAALRSRLGLTQEELGRLIYGYDDGQQCRKAGHRLEKGKTDPSRAAAMTLSRLEAGRLNAQDELAAL